MSCFVFRFKTNGTGIRHLTQFFLEEKKRLNIIISSMNKDKKINGFYYHFLNTHRIEP